MLAEIIDAQLLEILGRVGEWRWPLGLPENLGSPLFSCNDQIFWILLPLPFPPPCV
jgi:hypothetical protein